MATNSRPTRPMIIWPNKRVCQGCKRAFNTSSAIFLIESYRVKINLSSNRCEQPLKQKKYAIRWCPECGKANPATVKTGVL